MSVVIVDYGSGNLRSAAKAFERAAAETGAAVRVSARPEEVRAAERVVLPGVGAFADCMKGLAALPGMVEAIEDAAMRRARPFLGICVGMQLMAERGLEHGTHAGLGWFAAEVSAIEPGPARLRVPHMGWNELEVAAPAHPVFAGLSSGTHVYFVHGYAMRCRDAATVLATAEYGGPLVAAIGRANIVGTQFHPEKSQDAGLRLIRNFLAWKP